jgi:omega-hydroxy-beta-dihydromenaquinone-9 sulfotransferase
LKNAYLTAGTGLPQLIRLLLRNSVSCHPKYLLRVIFLLQSACWSSVFGLIENRRFRKKIEATQSPNAPLFIIGHWRTGSTLLHQLMQLDPEMITPTLFQVAEPGCFLVSQNYYKPVMKFLLDEYRPMDNVRLGMNEPQEDEYAIYRLTGHSPLERLVFPNNPNYFLREYPDFVPRDEALAEWEKQLLFFFKKLRYGKEKTIVSKNPFNSMRIKELCRLFPEARFIHLYRNPYDVVPSTLHLWNVVQSQNCLNRKGAPPSAGDVISYLGHVWEVIRRDLASLPKERWYEMKFENLEKDPVMEIGKLYSYFNLPISDLFRSGVEKFSREMKRYVKNEYLLPDEEKSRIKDLLGSHMEYFGYK